MNVSNDIDEFLKKKWIKALNLCDDESIYDLTESFKAKQNTLYKLGYQGKFYFTIGKYEQALMDLTKLLEIEPNNVFALKYRGETYYVMKRYKESLTDLNKLLEIKINNECNTIITFSIITFF